MMYYSIFTYLYKGSKDEHFALAPRNRFCGMNLE